MRPSAYYDALFLSAQCRARADWLIGMTKSTNETSWFMRIDHGEDLGSIIFSGYKEIAADFTLKKTLNAIIEWVKLP